MDEEARSDSSDISSMISLDEDEVFKDEDAYLVRSDIPPEERFFVNNYTNYINREVFEEDSNFQDSHLNDYTSMDLA